MVPGEASLHGALDLGLLREKITLALEELGVVRYEVPGTAVVRAALLQVDLPLLLQQKAVDVPVAHPAYACDIF